MGSVNYAWDVSAINRDDLIAFEEWYSIYEKYYYDKEICIWGAGIRGTEFGIFLKRHENNKFIYLDNNKEKWGGNIDGVPIISTEIGIGKVKSKTAIILIATENYKSIKDQLENVGLVVNKDIFIAHNYEYENFVKEFNKENNCKTIVMGDCLFSGISIKDKNNKNLAEMMRSKLGESECKVLYMHGMGIRSYYNIFKLYCENYPFPKCIEVMINFETLTGKQHLLPRSQHSQLFDLLKNSVRNINEEFLDYINVVNKRSDNIQIEMSHASKNLTKEQEKYLKTRNYLKINYMYELDTEVEGLVYFRKLCEYANSNGIKVIAFIPPLNYQLAESIFGNKLEELYNKNLKKINALTDSLGIELIDLSHSLTSDYFAEVDTTDESVNEKGRIFVCEKLSSKISKE